MSPVTTAARGRRPGGPDTRATILTAARASFADRGYAGTTIRAVAAAAEVDPALVHHYFGTKDDLFLAALEFPLDPREVLAGAFAGGLDGAGERFLAVVLEVWDDERTRLSLLALLRNGLTDERGTALLTGGLGRLILGPLGQHLPGDQARLRASLVASQVVGVIVSRYLLRLEPVASMPREQLVGAIAPTLQHYFTGALEA